MEKITSNETFTETFYENFNEFLAQYKRYVEHELVQVEEEYIELEDAILDGTLNYSHTIDRICVFPFVDWTDELCKTVEDSIERATQEVFIKNNIDKNVKVEFQPYGLKFFVDVY